MPVKMKYSPDQRLLGVFVDGLPKDVSELPKPEVEEEETRSFRRKGFNEEGVYDFNDMVNPAVEVVFGLSGKRILVCPDCKVDVELVRTPVLKHPYSRPDDRTLFADGSEPVQCSFAECLKCQKRFFMSELVASKSFRLPMRHESTASYFPYLTCVWLKDDWRVLIGRAVTDVSGVATGKTWVE